MVIARRQFVGLCCVLGVGALAGAGEPTKGDAAFEERWADLEKEEVEATRALLKLSARPKEVVAFLASKLKPLVLDADTLRAHLVRLADEKEEVWKPSWDYLDYFDPRLAIDLPALMEEVVDERARSRVVELMSNRTMGSLAEKHVNLRPTGGDGYNFFDGRGSWWAEVKVERINGPYNNIKTKWTRAVRALVLLEHIGTPEAVAVLKDMAGGHPEAQPSRVAKEALGRAAAK